MLKLIAAAGVLAALAVAPARAAEAPPAAWSGFHLGVQGGWAQRSGPAGFVSPGARRLGQGEKRDELDGQVFAGWDLSLPGRLVLGAEAMAGRGGQARQNLVNGRTNGDTDPKWNYALSARVGAAVGPRALLYARAGYAAERVHDTYTGPIILIFPPPPTSGDRWLDGPLLGIGGELAVRPHLALRLEYDHRSLDGGYKGDSVLLGGLWRF